MINQKTIESLETQYNVRILPVKIIGGRRWSFTGKECGILPAGETKRIPFDSENGVIVYNWHILNDLQKTTLTNTIVKLGTDNA